MADHNFDTTCVNWNAASEECYCVGQSTYEDGTLADTSDYCVRSDDADWGVAVPRGTDFLRDCENDDGFEHGCPTGMEPIIPRSREHWVRSVCHWFP